MMSHVPMRITEVPDLDNVSPFISDPTLADDSVDPNAGATQSPGTLAPYNPQVAYLYGNGTSIAGKILDNKVNRALEMAWKFDSRACSTTAARKLPAIPYHGLTKEEFNWIKESGNSAVATAIKERQNETDLAKRSINKDKAWVTYEPYPNFDDIDIDQELDSFYGPGPYTDFAATENMAINHDQLTNDHEQVTIDHEQFAINNDQLATEYDQLAMDYENFNGDSLFTTWVTLPQSNRALAGPLTSGTFHDSAIHMDDHFAAEANKTSPPQSARNIPSEHTPHRPNDQYQQWVGTTVQDSLALFEASLQPTAGNEQEAPYDLSGFVSSGSEYSASEDSRSLSRDVEMVDDEFPPVMAGSAAFAVFNTGDEESLNSQTGIAQQANLDTYNIGYLHNGAGIGDLPLEHSLDVHGGDMRVAGAISNQDTSQFETLNPNRGVYDTPSAQLVGEFEAYAGPTTFANPVDIIHHGGSYVANNSITTVKAKRNKHHNLVPQYDEENGFIDITTPVGSTTGFENTGNASTLAITGNPENPYDYRHFLTPTASSNAISGITTNIVAFTPIHPPTSTRAHHSLHGPSSPSPLPPSSPPLLPYTPDPLRHLLNTDLAHFTDATSMTLTTGSADPVSPSPAPKGARLGIHPQSYVQDTARDPSVGEIEVADNKMAAMIVVGVTEQGQRVAEEGSAPEGENQAIKDVFGVQQKAKRRVGRPVGSKTVNKNARAKKDKEFDSKDKNKAADPVDESETSRKSSAESSKSTPENKKSVEQPPKMTSAQAFVAAVQTTRVTKRKSRPAASRSIKNQEPGTPKHADAATTSDTEPKKKRVRRPSRKSEDSAK